MIRKIFSPIFFSIRHLRNKLLLGILLLVPLIATILILVWAFNSVDNILQPIIRSTWGIHFPGIGVAIVLVLAYIAGIIASSILGRKIISGEIKEGSHVLVSVFEDRLSFLLKN